MFVGYVDGGKFSPSYPHHPCFSKKYEVGIVFFEFF